MIYKELFKVLHDAKVRYVITGGLAVNLYGISRMTADIDLVVDFEKENLALFENAMKQMGYVTALPIPLSSLLPDVERKRLIKEKNLIAFSFHHTKAGYVNVDVLVDVPMPFEELWKTRSMRAINGFKIYIVSKDALIQMKEYSNRIQDKKDAELLRKLK